MLTEYELQKEGLAIKEGSEPLILERWAVGADKKYHCFELPLYDISSLEGSAETLDAYSRQELPQPYQPSDMRSIKVPLLTAVRSGIFSYPYSRLAFDIFWSCSPKTIRLASTLYSVSFFTAAMMRQPRRL